MKKENYCITYNKELKKILSKQKTNWNNYSAIKEIERAIKSKNDYVKREIIKKHSLVIY